MQGATCSSRAITIQWNTHTTMEEPSGTILARDRTNGLPISGWPALPPEPRPPSHIDKDLMGWLRAYACALTGSFSALMQILQISLSYREGFRIRTGCRIMKCLIYCSSPRGCFINSILEQTEKLYCISGPRQYLLKTRYSWHAVTSHKNECWFLCVFLNL